MPLPANTRLGRYEIRSLLGVGGMGEVYLAEDTTLRRLVAIKLLPAALTADQDRLHRFEREAFAASSLNHPNILTIHEIGAENGHHFITTEFIDGKSLRQYQKDKRLELSEILEVGVQVASALAAAHAARIVHRDIKPENIMVRKDGIGSPPHRKLAAYDIIRFGFEISLWDGTTARLKISRYVLRQLRESRRRTSFEVRGRSPQVSLVVFTLQSKGRS